MTLCRNIKLHYHVFLSTFRFITMILCSISLWIILVLYFEDYIFSYFCLFCCIVYFMFFFFDYVYIYITVCYGILGIIELHWIVLCRRYYIILYFVIVSCMVLYFILLHCSLLSFMVSHLKLFNFILLDYITFYFVDIL